MEEKPPFPKRETPPSPPRFQEHKGALGDCLASGGFTEFALLCSDRPSAADIQRLGCAPSARAVGKSFDAPGYAEEAARAIAEDIGELGPELAAKHASDSPLPGFEGSALWVVVWLSDRPHG